MMFDDERPMKPKRLGFDVVLDEVAITFGTVELSAASARCGATEQSEPHVLLSVGGCRLRVASAQTKRTRSIWAATTWTTGDPYWRSDFSTARKSIDHGSAERHQI